MPKAKKRKKDISICDECSWRNITSCYHPSLGRERFFIFSGEKNKYPVEMKHNAKKCEFFNDETPLREPKEPFWFTHYMEGK